MAALIYVDLANVHPVIDGVWHRASLLAMPDPGQGITMLCGVTATAEYERLDNRNRARPPTCCWDCDAKYRRIQGIPHRSTGQLPTPRPRGQR